MSVAKGKGPIFDPGVCRCCGSLKRCRLLNVEYQCMGQKEVYADMIMDCFGLLLSHLDEQPSARLVCATCVARLREAAAFRAQVLRCEAAFLQLRMCETEAADQKARLQASALLEVEIKPEPPDGSEPGDPPDPDDPGDPPDLDDPDDPDDPAAQPPGPDDAESSELVIDETLENPPVKREPPADSDSVPLKRRKRRAPGGGAAVANPPPKPVDAGLTEDQEERRISPEDEAELWKHRANIKILLEFSNATPIRCFSGDGYKCSYCTDSYPNPNDLKTHTLAKHDVKTRRVLMHRNFLFAFLVRLDITGLKCQICEAELDSIELLTEHLRVTHEKKLHVDVKSHLLPFKFDDGLKCVVCAKVFTKFRSLQEHMNIHFRNYICDVCETGYPNKRMLVQHYNMHKTGVFNCEYCPKTFNTDQKKKLHERFVHISANSKFLNKCGMCKERFKSYRIKEQHMLQVHGVSSAVKCQACEKSFKNQRYLTIHVQRDHLMLRPHKCPLCDMSFFGSQELKNHSVKHTGLREFRCEICSKAYGRQKTLREHMRVHEERRFKCELCGLGFVQRCSWRGHMRSKHKLPMHKVQQIMRERDPSYMIESNVVVIVEYSYVCPFKCRHNHLLCYYCGANFSDPNLLRHHTTTEHQPKKFKVIEHKKMIKVDLTRIDCRLCSEKISDIEDFKRHITEIHKKKYYFNSKDLILPFRLTSNEQQCALCDEVFPYFHALNKHMNKHFSNYVCETCGLGFVDKGRFVMHQQRHEEGDFPCDTCGKIFKAQYNRDLHIDRVHNKRGRVFCPKCDAKLMSYTQKLKHLVEVHGDAPLSFPCSSCDRVFGTRRTLTIHRRKDHLKDYRYECQFCGQKFFTRFALNNHMPTHTRERNFKCKVCEKTYPRLKTLKDHMRIHTNDRRYRCHVCGQAFIQNCSLKGHMKSQHSEYG